MVLGTLVLNLMAKSMFSPGRLPKPAPLMWCGEAIPTPALIHWDAAPTHASFTNPTVPTETTIASSYHTVPRCPHDEREQSP